MDREQDEEVRLACVKYASDVFASQIGCKDEAGSPLELAKRFYDWIMEPENDFREGKRRE